MNRGDKFFCLFGFSLSLCLVVEWMKGKILVLDENKVTRFIEIGNSILNVFFSGKWMYKWNGMAVS